MIIVIRLSHIACTFFMRIKQQSKKGLMVDVSDCLKQSALVKQESDHCRTVKQTIEVIEKFIHGTASDGLLSRAEMPPKWPHFHRLVNARILQ